MKNKRICYLTTVIITASMLSFAGCSKQEEPVTTETIEETQEPEEEIMEPEETEPEEPEKEENESDIAEEEEVAEEEEIVEEESEPDFEIISMDDTTYYATTNCNVRSGPGTTYSVVNGLSFSQGVVVNGRVETEDSTWYVIKTDSSEDMQMVSSSLLSTTKPAAKSSGNGGSGQTGNGGQQSGGSTGGGSSSSGGLEADGEMPPEFSNSDFGGWVWDPSLGGLY